MARLSRRAAVRNVASTSDPAAHVTEITFTGVPDGMFPGLPVHEIPDTGARYIKDAFVHNPGLLTRRGPVQPVSGMADLPYPACGMASVVDPTGTTRVGVLHGDATHGYLGVYSPDFTVRTDVALGVNLGTSPYKIVQIAPRLNGGVFISITDKFAQGAAQNLLLWKGGANGTYSTGTVTTTRGSVTVIGSGSSWRANASAGMFLFAGGVYVGTVKTINNDGSLTLEKAALATSVASAYTLQPFRGVNARVGKGFITTSTANATVNGANTKFQADGLGTGTWDIFRSSDMTFIGTVSAITSDIQLTLTANAPLNLDQEPYTAIRRDGSYANQPVGMGAIPSIWAGRQAYANLSSDMESTSRIWFSSVDDAEAIDEARTDGDFIQVPSVGPAGVATPIVAMAPTPSSMLILKESEAYALFGQTTSQFAINPISQDGCLSPMSVQSWNGLVVYAGRQGIYMYDGQQAVNVTEENLGWFYQSCVKGFDSSKYRMWSMIERDHYFLFIEQVTPPIPVLKGAVSHPQTAFTIAVHLPTQAVTILENVDIRGSAQLPSNLVKGTWFVVNKQVTGTSHNGTLGRAAKGSVLDSGFEGYKASSAFTATESGSVNSITSWVNITGSSVTARAMLYADNGSNAPGALLGVSSDVVMAVGASQQITFTFPAGSNIVAGQKYWLTVGFDGTGGGVGVWCEPSGTGVHVYKFGATATNPYGAIDGTSSTAGDMDISLSYTVAPVTGVYGVVCSAEMLFDSDGNDAFACVGSTQGPDFYLETKKYTIGDALLKKLWKMLLMTYVCAGDSIRLDTVPGFNEIGTTAKTAFPPSAKSWQDLQNQGLLWQNVSAQYPIWDAPLMSQFITKRIKFLKRSQAMSFRFWQNSSSVTAVVLGPWSVVMKPQRVGRV